MRVVKYRGVKFRGGYHDYVIQRGGIEVFPRLVAAEHRQPSARDQAAERHRRARHAAGRWPRGRHEHADRRRGGNRQVDGGRPVRRRPRRAAASMRPCSSSTRVPRRSALGAPGWTSTCRPTSRPDNPLQQVDPAELTPGEFVHAIRDAVEERQAKVVVIDSLNGYLNAMPEERYPDDPVARAADVLGSTGRRHDPDRCSSGSHRRPDDYAQSMPLTLRTP